MVRGARGMKVAHLMTCGCQVATATTYQDLPTAIATAVAGTAAEVMVAVAVATKRIPGPPCH